MRTADERLRLIRQKVERAKEHLDNLNNEVLSFFVSKPYVVGTKRDPRTRRLIYYVVRVRETPARIPIIASDVLHNLRSALDHLAFSLVEVRGFIDINDIPLTDKEKRDISFPIIDTDDPARYKTARVGRLQGMSQAAIDLIDATKPYKGGDDALWQLHKLNNVDKHRTLLTAGSAYRSVNIWPTIQRTIQQVFSDPALGPVPPLDLFLKPADRMFPLKQGDELFADLPDAEVNEKMQFRFDVAFSEPQVIEGEPLLETLGGMVDRVDNIILSFKPFMA